MPRRRAMTWVAVCIISAIIPACLIVPQPGPPLSIGPDELPNAAEGLAYTRQLLADGTPPLTWSVAAGSLPPGLSLASESGLITGIPTAPGTFSFLVRVQDSSFPVRIGEKAYSLTIIARLVLNPALPPARVGVLYSAGPSATGGIVPYQFRVVGLPAGLTYDTATGVISGTPLNPYAGLPLDITVTDSGQPQQSAAGRTLLVIKPPPVSITTTALASGRVGQFYTQQMIAANGRPPYKWSVPAGVLPDNLRLNLDTGVISGVPKAAGAFTFTVRVTDSDSPPTLDAREFTITIEP